MYPLFPAYCVPSQKSSTLLVYALFLICSIFVGSCTLPSGEPENPRVILVSVDGLRAEVFLHPENHGFSPNELQNFLTIMKEGAYVREVTTVFPSLTYPSHTSMVTGVYPNEHGIIHNRLFDSTGKFLQWYWWADSIQAPTLFDLAQDKGLVTAVVPWPVSVDGPFDYCIPEITSIQDGITTLDVVRRYDKPWWLLEYFVFFGGLKGGEAATEGFTRDLNLHRMFKTIFRKHLPHLIGYHIIQTDDFQHEFGKDSPEAHRAYIFADSLIGEVIDLITELGQWDETTLIVTGDHGHRDFHTRININALFVNKGLIQLDENGAISGWEAMAHPSGGAAFIRLKNRDNEETKSRVRNLLSGRDEWYLSEIKKLPTLLRGYEKATFVLFANPGYAFTRTRGPLFSQHRGSTHGGDPRDPQLKTVLFAMGRGIQRGAIIDSTHTTQTAILIATLLDLPIEAAIKPPSDLLKPKF